MRNFPNWLEAFMQYASFGEAPKRMYFWTGVSALAGALQRKVWIDQAYFRWYPNFYIVLVAPPGVVSKSTTAGIGMDLLRQVEGVHFGPEVVTWQALAGAFNSVTETFTHNGEYNIQSALSIESSEFGNLLDPQDAKMVDFYVTMWDGKSLRKETKSSGNDDVQNPCLNLIACTTPSWIAGNFPEYLIGGGLTSRMAFVYADQKERFVAYPKNHVPKNFAEIRGKLIEDLNHIFQNLVGEYTLTERATAWGEQWYENHYRNRPKHLDDERFGGYIARKQTHIHKLAIVLAASERDTLQIDAEDLDLANAMVTDLEAEMNLVFSRIGKTDDSFHADRVVAYIKKQGRDVPYSEVFRYVHAHFPSLRNFEDMLYGLINAGFLKTLKKGDTLLIRHVADPTLGG